jgi:hypothetical protein
MIAGRIAGTESSRSRIPHHHHHHHHLFLLLLSESLSSPCLESCCNKDQVQSGLGLSSIL